MSVVAPQTYSFTAPPATVSVAPTRIVPLSTLSAAPYTYQTSVPVASVPLKVSPAVDYDGGMWGGSRWGMIILGIIIIILVLVILALIIWIIVKPRCSKCRRRWHCRCVRL